MSDFRASWGVFVLIVAACARGFAEEPVMIDVFVSGTEGYHTFRIPALIVTSKGTILAFCEGRKSGRKDDGDIDLVLKRSSDGGKTWGALQIVHEEGGDEKITIGNPCPVVDRSTGTIWLPMCRNNDRVLMTHSDDDGKTWAPPVDITAAVKKPEWDWYATGPVNGIQLGYGPHVGRLVIPCDHRVKDSPDWKKSGRSHVIYSDDHGKLWKLGGITESGMNECSVAELADGTLSLNMRSYRGTSRRAISLSKDGGLTWSPPQDDAALIESVCQGSLLACRGGAFGTEGVLLFCNPATEKGRNNLTLRLSRDGGKTWSVSRLIYEKSSAYSCLALLPEGNIGLIFERDNYGKLTLMSLDAKTLAAEKGGG